MDKFEMNFAIVFLTLEPQFFQFEILYTHTHTHAYTQSFLLSQLSIENINTYQYFYSKETLDSVERNLRLYSPQVYFKCVGKNLKPV